MGIFIPVMELVVPILNPRQVVEKEAKFKSIGLLRWEDGKDHALPQDFADMLGWKEMTEKTIKAYEQIPAAERSNTMILCDNYGEAGAINFYNNGKLPPALSFGADYLTWFPEMEYQTHFFVLPVVDPTFAEKFNAYVKQRRKEFTSSK